MAPYALTSVKRSPRRGGEGASNRVLATKGVLGSDLPTELWAVAKNSYARPHSKPDTVWRPFGSKIDISRQLFGVRVVATFRRTVPPFMVECSVLG